MLTEPDISEWNLARISIPVLVLAGERDMVKPKETKGLRSLFRTQPFRFFPEKITAAM